MPIKPLTNRNRIIITVTVVLILLALLVSSFGIYVVFENKKNDKAAGQILKQLRSLMPNSSGGFIDKNLPDSLPSLEVDGIDFAGVLEYEPYSLKYPVYSHWNSMPYGKRPAVYSGSAANGTLVICSDIRTEQMYFADTIDVGGTFIFTDVLGKSYSYRLEKIQHIDVFNMDRVYNYDCELTVLVRNTVTQYLALRCKFGE